MPLAMHCLEIDVFETTLGWFATAHDGRFVRRIVIGHNSPAGARRAILRQLEADPDDVTDAAENSFLLGTLRAELQEFARGNDVDFSEFSIELSHLTPFQKRIARIVRRIPYGRTLSYGEVARQAGSPRAARAVGSVMANNRFPILIPCHRVLASNGGLGGFSAPGGVRFKERMLELESGNRHGQTI